MGIGSGDDVSDDGTLMVPWSSRRASPAGVRRMVGRGDGVGDSGGAGLERVAVGGDIVVFFFGERSEPDEMGIWVRYEM